MDAERQKKLIAKLGPQIAALAADVNDHEAFVDLVDQPGLEEIRLVLHAWRSPHFDEVLAALKAIPEAELEKLNLHALRDRVCPEFVHFAEFRDLFIAVRQSPATAALAGGESKP